MKADSKETKVARLITPNAPEYIAGSNCREIEEHQAAGEGDKWYYDVWISEDTFRRIFTFDEAVIVIKGD